MLKQATTGVKDSINQNSNHNHNSTPGTGFSPSRRRGIAAPAGSLATTSRRLRTVLAMAAVLLGTVAGAKAQAIPFPNTNVASSSDPQCVSVTLAPSTTASAVQVVTTGLNSGSEFTMVAGPTSCTGPSGTDTVPVVFRPMYPGLRLGAVVVLDASGNVIGTAYLSGVGMGGLDVLSPGYMTTVAGTFGQATGSSGPGDGGLATSVTMQLPASVVADGAGNLYIADELNLEVRMICFAQNSATIAGISCPGPGIIVKINVGTQQLLNPTGVALDGAGNLYIADTGNHTILEVTAANGAVTTVAGDGKQGFTGDGGLATAAELSSPAGVTIDASGNIFIADTGNSLIRRVDAISGIITTVAGGGTGTKGTATGVTLNAPYAVAFNAAGDMYIPDSGNNLIRKAANIGGIITPASPITTVAGTGEIGGGCIKAPSTPLTTPLNTPEGIAVDPAGNLYIADSKDECVLKTNGTASMIPLAAAGNFTMTPLNPAGMQGQTFVNWPRGIVVDRTGNVFFADYFGDAIEEVQSNLAVLDFLPTVILDGGQSTPIAQIVENDGNLPSELDAVNALPDNNAALATPPTTCDPNPPTSSFPMLEDADCTIGAVFAPSTVGTLAGNIFVTGNTPNDSGTPGLDIMFFGRAATFKLSLTANTVSPAYTTTYGSPVALLATLVGSNATGTVTFTDSLNGGPPTTLKSVTVTMDTAELTESTLAVGVHTITATFTGNSFPATVTVTVDEPTSTTLTSSPNPSVLGNPVTLTATVSAPAGSGQSLAGGTVTFSNTTASTSSMITITASGTTDTVTFPAPASWFVDGVNQITAVYTPPASSPLILESNLAMLNQDVQVSTSISVTSSLNPSTYGTPVTFTANVTGGPTTGTVTFYDGPTRIGTGTLAGNTATFTTSALAVGSHSITAAWAANSDFSAATSPAIPQVVTATGTTTTVAASPNPGIAGAPVALTATVKPISGSAAITGTVTFTDGTTTLGTATLSAAGTATINPTLAAGAHAIVATYAGSTNDVGSTSSALALEVNLAVTAATVSASPNPALVLSPITFTATVTGNGGIPTGSVTFFANGSINLGSGTLNGTGTAQMTNATLPAGSYQITAVYPGDANNAGTSSAAVKLVVGRLPTSTNLGSAATTGSNSQLILVATVADTSGAGPIPAGTVTFTSGTTILGTSTLDASGVATLTPNLNVGTYTIVASYGGDALHSPSQSAPFSVSSQGSSYSLTVTPSALNLASSQNTMVAVTLSSISGFTDTIGLGCASLPAGVNCHFSNLSVPLAATTPATVQLTIDTNNPLGGGATSMNRKPGPRKTEMAGLLFPISLLMGWVLWNFRRRHARVLSMLLILILSGAAMMATGCGGFTQNSAAAGTYTFQVVGVGANSNVTEFQNVTLTITK